MPRVVSSLLITVWLWLAAFPVAAEPGVTIPVLFDLKRKIDRPDLGSLRQIRFLTEDDFPPFHFIGPDGQLTGFEVDLARALCAELKLACSIQPRRWDVLKDSLLGGQGDAIIAALRITAEARREMAFSAPYFRNPARFVTRRSAPFSDAAAATLSGRLVTVVEHSAHEAFLKSVFPGAVLRPVADAATALDQIGAGGVDFAFVDGVAAAFFLNGEASRECCRFVGGPYLDNRYFGEGSGIAVARGNTRLVQALDWALHRLAADGTYATLYLKYFPVGIY